MSTVISGKKVNIFSVFHFMLIFIHSHAVLIPLCPIRPINPTKTVSIQNLSWSMSFSNPHQLTPDWTVGLWKSQDGTGTFVPLISLCNVGIQSYYYSFPIDSSSGRLISPAGCYHQCINGGAKVSHLAGGVKVYPCN